MRGLGALPESAEATECPGRLLGQLGFGMGLEGDGALLDLGGGAAYTQRKLQLLWAWAERLEGRGVR